MIGIVQYPVILNVWPEILCGAEHIQGISFRSFVWCRPLPVLYHESKSVVADPSALFDQFDIKSMLRLHLLK